MNYNINEKSYNEIAKLIESDGPVGIDAKKTHIIIINALAELHTKIDKLEKEIAELKK
ncbi:MAG: hypothetical protein KF732_07650 [Flavobacteriales bacterium]|jgi:hypothetical protein|nr:hypothetical protein [Flavobacteriales bacterium]HRN42568.1 hypothetical protein [Vicingus sp.]